MTHKIVGEGGHLAHMWNRRDAAGVNETVLTRYRVCNLQEAINTWMYCLAGGRHVALTRDKPTEMQAVQQVGNNEGMPGTRSGPDPRIAKLLSMGIQIATPPPRPVVEYSLEPAAQFLNGQNTVITVGINSAFCVAGSGLSFEGGGGTVVQIGTPLSWVDVDPRLLETAFPDRLA
ncbi:hypothetical protein [uncultured Massilia sp.]|uniref:hypothetical protein n=1 Tax=uncultured Massilia sp. TaxID=169973 RepID=UPI0025DAF2CF|nr:hypothetical protein [uncultured Massilia sp.]